MLGKRLCMVYTIMIGLALSSALLSLCWGSYEMSVWDVVTVLLGGGEQLQQTAVLTIRLPRVLLGMAVAAALAVSGGILQTTTKNELADPGIIGINAGGAVAAVLFIGVQTSTYYSELGVASIFVLPVMAICGSFVTALLIYLLSCRKALRPRRLLLVGIGVNAGLNAFIMGFTFRGSIGDYNKVLIWLTGSLWGTGFSYVRVLIPMVALALGYVLYKGSVMNAMNFSDETAIGWGVSVEKERKKMLLVAVVLAGAATAFAGNISFLGLLAPHIARKLVGPNHRHFLPLAAVTGMTILLFSDAISRNLFSPVEIPAGITVSVVGVPYFIYLILKK